jgi:hypothetical protein
MCVQGIYQKPQALQFIIAPGFPLTDTSIHVPKSNLKKGLQAQPELHRPMQQRWLLHCAGIASLPNRRSKK